MRAIAPVRSRGRVTLDADAFTRARVGGARTRAGRRRTRAASDGGGGDAGEDAGEDGGSRRWKPTPLPSTFGDADGRGRAASPFERDGGEMGKAVSPFGAATGGGAKAASPFGAAKPASPFGAAGGGDKAAAVKPARPFGAAEARSPFAAAPGSAAAKSPFGGASAAKNPFNEPEAALYGAAPAKKKAQPAVEEEKKSLLESLPRPSLGQVVIVLSFTTIIALMLGTFWVVVNAGGVHFND